MRSYCARILLLCSLFYCVSAEQLIVATWNYENAVNAGCVVKTCPEWYRSWMDLSRKKPRICLRCPSDYIEVELAWQTLQGGQSAVDAAEVGCALCEAEQCRGTVGWGNSPDELGETTLDAMLIDGTTMNMGAVGGLRFIKNAVGVARHVLDHTQHTFLVGDAATEFAVKMGFQQESLSSPNSTLEWQTWLQTNCQPNFWVDMVPDPTTSCGPYTPLSKEAKSRFPPQHVDHLSEDNHDTIGMVVVDANQRTAAGTSTNGLTFHIPGRVGDTPIPGAGGYADDRVGAAAATGNGDIFMRFLPSFVAVEEMRRGATPTEAATTALQRILEFYPVTFGGVVAANLNGEYGAACIGLADFPYTVYRGDMAEATVIRIPCLTPEVPRHRKNPKDFGKPE